MYPFGVTVPNGAKSGIEFDAFNMFALRTEELEAVISALATVDDPNDPMTQQAVFHQCGVRMNSLSPSEIDYIEREVARRWGA